MADPPPGAGLQPERTALAWHRTAVAGTAVAGVAVLAAAHSGHVWLVGVTAVVAGVAALLGVLCSDPGPGHRSLRRGVVIAPVTSVWFRLTASAVVVVLVGASGVLLAVVG